MRVGTWNLDAQWSPAHSAFLRSLDADILLLTEVIDAVALPGMHLHATTGRMERGQRWAAVASRALLRPRLDPHGATALVDVGGLLVASSILPWRTCKNAEPWVGETTTDKTRHAVEAIEATNPTIWGGDWNHSLIGREYVGSRDGRTAIQEALDRLGLAAATTDAPHRLDGVAGIDHIAVPAFWDVASVDRVRGIVAGTELSDHDAYVVEIR